jgi:hypothetical protein
MSDNFARGLLGLLTGFGGGYVDARRRMQEREDELARQAAEDDYRKQTLARLLAGDEADAKQRALDLEKYKLNLQMGPDDTATPWTSQMGPFENQYHGSQLGDLIINKGAPPWQSEADYKLEHGLVETNEQRARREAEDDARRLVGQKDLAAYGAALQGGTDANGAVKPPMPVGQFLNYGSDMAGDTSSMAYAMEKNAAQGDSKTPVAFPSYDAWLRRRQNAGLARADSTVGQYAGRGMLPPPVDQPVDGGTDTAELSAKVKAARMAGIGEQDIVDALRADGLTEQQIVMVLSLAATVAR